MAIKSSNNGPFTIPTAPAVGTTCAQSSSANTYGSYVQLTASTGEADYIIGISIVNAFAASGNIPNYIGAVIGTGTAASEVAVATVSLQPVGTTIAGGSTASVGGTMMFAVPIPIANATRIAVKTASDIATAFNWKVTLHMAKQADWVDAGINESANATQINGVSTSSVTTVNANQGTTQPINFTGTGASALAKSDMVDIAGSAVSTSTAQIGVNAVQWNGLTTVALPLIPTTAGRTLDVSSTGEAGVDWANVGSPTTTLALTGTTIAVTQKVDVDTIKTNPVVNGGTVTFPTNATLASTTNITAATVTLNTSQGGVTFSSLTVSGATVLTGNVSMAAGLNITQSTADTSALVITGNGTGSGIRTTGGSTGHGIFAISGNGATGNGVYFLANSTNGSGIVGQGTGNKHGMAFTGGDTGNGAQIVGGSTSGPGLYVTANGDHAASFLGVGTSKHGILVQGGAAGTSDGLKLVAGTGGVGLRADTITTSGTVTLNALTVTNTMTVNAFTCTNNFTVSGNWLTTGTTTWTGAAAFSAGLTSNITGTASGNATAAQGAHLDADVSSRMATYTQPTGFLAANFTTGIPISGDLSATMKTSVTTAATAATPTINATQAFNNTGTWTGIVTHVTLVDTCTINTDMRGTDNAALAATALSTVVWTGSLATNLGTLAGHDPGGTLASSANQTTINNSVLAVPGQVTTDHGSGSYVRNTEPPTVGQIGAQITSDHGSGSYQTATGFATVNPDNTGIAAIRANTDQLTFGVANGLNVNVLWVRSQLLAGSGTASDPWRPA